MTSNDHRRLFIAAWPPFSVAERIADALIGLKAAAVRPVPLENLHVTLRFVGTANPMKVFEALQAVELPEVEAAVAGPAQWLDQRQLVIPVTGVDELAAAVRSATDHEGEPNRHEFFGHLTIARAKRAIETPLERHHFDQRFTVGSVDLVASDTLPTGARYETIARLPTTG